MPGSKTKDTYNMVSTMIPKQRLRSLVNSKTLMAPYNTSRAAHEMREAIHLFIELEGYDKLKALATALLAALPTAVPVILNATGTLSRKVPKVGQQVTAVPSNWDGIPQPTFTYQWKKAGVNIAGATAVNYVPITGEIGTLLSCLVTATNTGGTATELLSAAGNTVA